MTSGVDQTVRFVVNGEAVTAAPAGWTLARYLRDELGIHSVKVGCEEGSCGACPVLIDDEPVPSCLTPVGLCDGHSVDTADHLVATTDAGRLVASVLTERSAMQCGFCTAGIVCTLTALVQSGPADPVRAPLDPAPALSAHLCRCTGYVRYLDTIVELIS